MGWEGSVIPSCRVILVLFPGLFQPSLAAQKVVKEKTTKPVTRTVSLGHSIEGRGHSTQSQRRTQDNFRVIYFKNVL